jgi:hypothetical protein
MHVPSSSHLPPPEEQAPNSPTFARRDPLLRTASSTSTSTTSSTPSRSPYALLSNPLSSPSCTTCSIALETAEMNARQRALNALPTVSRAVYSGEDKCGDGCGGKGREESIGRAIDWLRERGRSESGELIQVGGESTHLVWEEYRLMRGLGCRMERRIERQGGYVGLKLLENSIANLFVPTTPQRLSPSFVAVPPSRPYVVYHS